MAGVTGVVGVTGMLSIGGAGVDGAGLWAGRVSIGASRRQRPLASAGPPWARLREWTTRRSSGLRLGPAPEPCLCSVPWQARVAPAQGCRPAAQPGGMRVSAADCARLPCAQVCPALRAGAPQPTPLLCPRGGPHWWEFAGWTDVPTCTWGGGAGPSVPP